MSKYVRDNGIAFCDTQMCVCQVEADRGEDIGRIARQISDLKPGGATEDVLVLSRDDALGTVRHEGYTKRILCLATQREIEILLEQVFSSTYCWRIPALSLLFDSVAKKVKCLKFAKAKSDNVFFQ